MATAEPMLKTDERSPCDKLDYFKVLLSLKLQDEDNLMHHRCEQSLSSCEPIIEARTRVASGLEQLRSNDPVNAR